jgi:peroxiredoxin Q/BCP
MNFLPVGEMAPDVVVTGATRWGVLDVPIGLERFRGQTVVLAFFPAARTRGCTIQMQTYRDEYERLFNGGRDVVLIAISNDSAADLASWASDEDFPFLFASDPSGDMYRAFGGIPNVASGRFGRTLVVLDSEGRIAELVPRFMEVDPTSYDALEATVAELAAR